MTSCCRLFTHPAKVRRRKRSGVGGIGRQDPRDSSLSQRRRAESSAVGSLREVSSSKNCLGQVSGHHGVSPITHFTRTATEDCELRGQQIRAGDPLALFFASANRDEEVFDDPFVFRFDRDPNPHLAFGVGEHFCLGAHVARAELEAVFRHLLVRLEEFEISGPVERLSSAINGGIKHLPLRYRLN